MFLNVIHSVKFNKNRRAKEVQNEKKSGKRSMISPPEASLEKAHQEFFFFDEPEPTVQSLSLVLYHHQDQYPHVLSVFLN